MDGSKSSIISIHALLAESDRYCLRHSAQSWYFYPRSPCGERHFKLEENIQRAKFLSTLSLRRATMTSALACAIIVFLSTLSLRRATNNSVSTADKEANFYPRSPCGERRCCHSCTAHSRQFLSTLSLRRATLRVVDGSKSSIISIHALLAESDTSTLTGLLRRSPFLSTLSLRRATTG